MKAVFLSEFEVFHNSTFFIGLPSIGNVGQLAVDGLICTLSTSGKLDYIGCLESEHVLPMIGYDHFGVGASPRLCMPVEGRQKLFSESLLSWLRSVQYASAIVLTGASTEDRELVAGGCRFHIVSTAAREALLTLHPESVQALLNTSSEVPYPVQTAAAQSSRTSVFGFASSVQTAAADSLRTEEVLIDDLMSLRSLTVGGGSAVHGVENTLPLGMTMARFLVEAAVATADNGSKGSVAVLGTYVGEGDNLLDGLQLAAAVMTAFDLGSCMSGAPGEKRAPLSAVDIARPASWARIYGHGIRDTNMFY